MLKKIRLRRETFSDLFIISLQVLSIFMVYFQCFESMKAIYIACNECTRICVLCKEVG